MKQRIWTVPLAAAPVLLLAAFGWSSDKDYERFDPPPATALANLTEGPGLAAAVAVAEDAAKGRAVSASVDAWSDSSAFHVQVFAADGLHAVTVARATGEILADEVVSVDLPGWPIESAWQSTASGLRYVDVRVGEGEQPSTTSQVSVHYSGWLNDGTKFDSSVDRGEPTTFPLDGVIRGWTEGVSGMRVGGQRKLAIPYKLAYGPAGRGPIPPRATLIFDIELLEILR